MKPKKILIVGPSLQDQGGVANYYNAVYPRLSCSELDFQYLQIGSTHGQGSKMHAITDQFRFWKMITRCQPDVVHLNPSLDLRSFLRDGVFIILARILKKPVLIFFRGWQESFEQEVEKKYLKFFRVTYGRADRFVVLAEKFSNKLRAWGVTAPIRLGSTAVANEMLNDFSLESKIGRMTGAGPIRLLYLARLERGKGVLELMEAVEALLNKGVPISLTVAGDGRAMDEVRQRAKMCDRYRDAINIVGYVRGGEKIEILKSHDIYCFPTQYGEGMPNSLLEAMAFGMPVVTCPVGGIGDFFDEDRMGVLLNGNSPSMIENAIESLLADRQKLVEMARYNSEYARRHFLASSAAEMLREQYHEILGNGS